MCVCGWVASGGNNGLHSSTGGIILCSVLLVSVTAVTKDTLQQWSGVTSQPVSLVASCYALEQLKLLSDQSGEETVVHLIAANKMEVECMV